MQLDQSALGPHIFSILTLNINVYNMCSRRMIQAVFSDAVLFLGVKQMQMSKFNSLLLQRLANFMSSIDTLIISADM